MNPRPNQGDTHQRLSNDGENEGGASSTIKMNTRAGQGDTYQHLSTIGEGRISSFNSFKV
jgi:hypothetical protein